MGENPCKKEVENFRKENLRKTETHMKDGPPSQKEIDEEKRMMEECSNPVSKEVENFNKKRLRKTSTEEHNRLPTQKEIDDEKNMMKAERK
ncbi:thymosin beta 1 [Syngnathoides biaculeatus]|uniref:thymosin beta 1 n=1 Tax=Syngnathoides biaculeatus TaxID=300417 RepID=UPI002ADD5EB6|nr:thymosin beta 1 [Syngnathoides biaculeatus]XP_061690310.1 thymosin beta 1 [Syngnathoides biaculeatus]